jgi:glycosyltransferase involved in cell wall biosynthesis
VNPETVIVSQGRVESGCAAVLAAKRAGIRTVSYIPMAHPVSVSGKPIAASLRDAVNRYFYQLPDKFVTISNGVRDMLRARGAKSPVAVVPNGIDPLTVQKSDRKEFRESHQISEHHYVVAVVGRIEFRQKRQDFALRSLARLRNKLRDWKLLFIGSGPDQAKLSNMISEMKVGDYAQVLPYIPTRERIYGGIDVLLIPSRFEGVPLVMLEAMSCGRPVVASNVDGMAESLPDGWLFPRENAELMIEILNSIRQQNVRALLEENRHKVAVENSAADFGPRFVRAALG